jgi:N-acetylglucosamine-6-phosphate deacetylase
LDLNQLKRIHKVLPKVTKVLAIAPEFKKNLLKYSKISQDFLIATGHTDASYDMAMHAFDLGGKRVTHLYNAMPNFDKRHPTILNAIFNRCDLKCELICDGAHVNNHVILNTYNILDADQIMIISDSLLTKGLPDGEYQVWGIAVDKRGILDYLHGTESIAGGNLPYHKQVENFGKITQCSMNDLLKVSSLNAARSLKQDKAFGNLVVGAESSFVLLDKNYQLKATFIKGQKI